MHSPSPSSQRGLLRGALLLLLLAAVAAGAGWWWFLGRFRVPEQAPARAESVAPVLDYADRKELGTDPLPDMEKPGLTDVGRGGAEAQVHLAKWGEAYARATAERLKWKTAEAAGAVISGVSPESYHLDYLHQAQLAEYYRARYRNALEE
jgi:hypothetical protein